MKLENKVSKEHLGILQNKAIEKYKQDNKKEFIDTLIFGIIGTALCVSAEIIFSWLGFSVWMLAAPFLAFCGIGVVFLTEGRSFYCAWKNPLTAFDIEEIYSNNLDVCVFNNNMREYISLEKAEILEYKLETGEVSISYVGKDEIVEKLNLLVDVKVKRGIDEPVLVLTDDGFVFYEPFKATKKE